MQLALYVVGSVIYNIYLHPLRKYPGPKLWAISRIPWNWVNLHGRLAWRLRELHQQYGPVVRIAPDELSYTTSTAWKKIYGQRTPEFSKALDGRGLAPPSINGIKGIVTEDQNRHSRLRRAIAPAFSERALRDQEGYLQSHSTNLVQQLKKRCYEGPQDVVKWFSLTTFDVISGKILWELSIRATLTKFRSRIRPACWLSRQRQPALASGNWNTS